jgi:nicotinamidase-related amidase
MSTGQPAVRGLLAVIDMQRVFAEPGSPWATPRFDEAAEGVRRLLPAFGARVTFTRFLAPEEPEGAWRAYYDQWPFALQPPRARAWELTDAFAGPARDVVDATTFGKWGPDLAERVGRDGRLVLAGVSTDCCVLSTALAAADAGVEVLVVADACAGANDDSHARALHLMDLYRPLVRVVTVEDVLRQSRPVPR